MLLSGQTPAARNTTISDFEFSAVIVSCPASYVTSGGWAEPAPDTGEGACSGSCSCWQLGAVAVRMDCGACVCFGWSNLVLEFLCKYSGARSRTPSPIKAGTTQGYEPGAGRSALSNAACIVLKNLFIDSSVPLDRDLKPHRPDERRSHRVTVTTRLYLYNFPYPVNLNTSQ